MTPMGRKAARLCLWGMLSLCLAGCGSGSAEEDAASRAGMAAEKAGAERNGTSRADMAPEKDGAESTGAEENPRKLSGSIRMAGSTSMERLVSALAEGFMEKYPEVDVTAEFVGSGAGIQAVLSGVSDIGNSSRRLKEEEKPEGIVEIPVAIDGIAVCVDPANVVAGLSRAELAGIYTGEITDWSQVGGESCPIVVIGHEAGSGTREAFEALLGIEDKCVYANELGSTGAVKARISVTPGAVGYVSFEVVDESIKALALEGVEPKAENVRSGRYPLSRPFLMVTEASHIRDDPVLEAWFDYVLGKEGREVAEKMGLIAAE